MAPPNGIICEPTINLEKMQPSTSQKKPREKMYVEMLHEKLVAARDPKEVISRTSLEPYLDCMDTTSSQETTNAQAEMCRSLHVMNALEGQLRSTQDRCTSMVSSVRDDLRKEKEEDVRVKLDFLNLIVKALKDKQELDDRYRAVIRLQKEAIMTANKALKMQAEAERDTKENDETIATPQQARESTLANLAVYQSSPADLELLNEISSDSGELFHEDDSEEEGEDFVSPEEADMNALHPWTQSNTEQNKASNDAAVHESEERERPPEQGIEQQEDGDNVDAAKDVAGDSKCQNTTNAEPDCLDPATEMKEESDSNSLRVTLSSNATTVGQSELNEVLEKAQSLVDAIRSKRKEEWEIGDGEKMDRSSSSRSTETRRSLFERRASSQSIHMLLESEDWRPSSQPTQRQRRRASTSSADISKRRPTLPKGLSSQALLNHIEKQSWGKPKDNQADSYFKTLERPHDTRFGTRGGWEVNDGQSSYL